ncbi:DUF3789 domain-containing protein [Aquibacillus kalidii]|nr:DUF3789 domain-containing protein [Aquibacillus kalidii]
MITFVLGTVFGSAIGIFIMSLMVIAKRADQINENRYIKHPF